MVQMKGGSGNGAAMAVEGMELEMDNGGEPGRIIWGNVLYSFVESEEAKALIARIPDTRNAGLFWEWENLMQRFTEIMNKYQYQPHLLDPHLDSLLELLLPFVRDGEKEPWLCNLACRFLQLICKVRGYKAFVRLFPHEVVDIVPVLELLEQENPADLERCQVRYILLLWLCMLVLIPFDLARFDGARPGPETPDGANTTLMDRILNIAKLYVLQQDPPSFAASILISRFVTRPDVQKLRSPQFLDWIIEQLHCEIPPSNREFTIKYQYHTEKLLYTLALIFKHGKREDFLPYASTVLHHLKDLNFETSPNIALRKVHSKLLQWLGLSYLKPHLAPWRYQRGSRCLLDNLRGPRKEPEVCATYPETREEDYEEVPEDVEEIIEQLLLGLKDKDTDVRWTAAKGIGRVTGRLPKQLADEVVASVLEYLSAGESSTTWHGVLIAFAELARRGLLLPSRLPDVVPYLCKALLYEDQLCMSRISIQVRDATCYVCWAFARAYDPKDLQPFVNEIARGLVIAALFDRQLNCRRAASAAFQENVGRQGTFPHGIDLVTSLDYFAAATLTNSYLNTSVYVAGFPEYTFPIIDHLVERKIVHLDSAICQLASKALHNLTPKAPTYMADVVLPKLLPLTSSRYLNTRYGAVLSCSEITHALYKLGRRLSDVLAAETIQGLKDIHSNLQASKRYRGLAGTLMRRAVCSLIEKLSLSHIPFKNDAIVESWQELIDDCLSNIHRFNAGDRPGIEAAATTALSALSREFYRTESGQALPGIQDLLLDHYLGGLHCDIEQVRGSFAMALGVLPAFLLRGRLQQVLQGLYGVAKTPSTFPAFHDARSDAVFAIASVCTTVDACWDGDEQADLCQENVDAVYNALMEAMNDFTRNIQGDVSLKVRVAAFRAMTDVTLLLAKREPRFLTADLMRRLMCAFAPHMGETAKNSQMFATSSFLKLLHHDSPPLDHIPHRRQLEEIFPRNEALCTPTEIFSCAARVLGLPAYRPGMLLVLLVAAGNVSTAQVVTKPLLEYIRSNEDSVEMNDFCELLLEILDSHLENPRISAELLSAVDVMLSSGCFDIIEGSNHPFPQKLFSQCSKFLCHVGNLNKLKKVISVFCGLMQFHGELRRDIAKRLLCFLGHRLLQVRVWVAEQLYEMLLMFDDLLSPEDGEATMCILSETNWEATPDTLKPVLDKLKEYMTKLQTHPV
uniref:tubulin-specific chaperone D isoform X2 n=1 Tax=Myxine glutinosa TaxID=7769 RepID=UPI00358F20B0